uniref:Reverse transcriptase domain-containing protein n=1 Tax=Lactuca sativa TaxID=4236 RepID=A0A9R1VGT6_LACSA|nr:hypothetical protein LSAT_V11C500253740 [Lactuca sativa]
MLQMCINYGKHATFLNLICDWDIIKVVLLRGMHQKTTCVTRYGSFKFIVMPFSLTNAPTMFCTLMNKLFHPFLDKFVVVYLHDIMVYSHSNEEHISHLTWVFCVTPTNQTAETSEGSRDLN